MTIIEQIKAEIDKLYGEYKDKFHQYGDQYHLGLIDGLDMAEQVLDTLESEKPLGLEEEIERKYTNDTTTLRTRSQYSELARYFYDLGCRRTAEKYDEIEYNRQRAEEQGSEELSDEISRISERYPEVSFAKLSRIAVHFAKWGAEHLADARKTSPKDLEEAAVDIADALLAKSRDYILSAEADYWNGAHDGIIDGAKWQKEQMMKGAVEAHIYQSTNPVSEIGHQLHQAALLYEDKENAPYLKAGDKVHIIIVKEE